MKNYVTGIKHTGSFACMHCIPCLVGKTPQCPFLHLDHCTSKPGSLLHIDMCGPFPVLSPQKDTYFLSILDDCTNFGFIGPLQQNSDAYKFYCCTEALIKHTSQSQVVTVCVNGTPELCEGHMGTHLWHSGIAVQITAPYAHQQNSKAECYIQTLEDGMQALIADSKLPPSFWHDAICAYQYLHNCLPISVLPAGITPFEAYCGCKPDLAHLWVWGCQCFVLIPPKLCTKGGPCHYKAIFVGYDEDQISWYIQDLKGTYHFSYDIIFNESVPGHLASVCAVTTVPVSSPSFHPICSHVCITGGQAFADIIHAQDTALASHHSQCVAEANTQVSGGELPLSLMTVLDFVSLATIDSFLDSEVI